ncbi:MAG: prolipoprotein diacylglyceryl transferase, partial [Gemmatimonadota bacterium]|nr:prolipoprotein diacylglyceryl transferase [Gemmatimonadota bacterium]
TVYPLTFSLFGFEITGFGILMMLAFLVAGWVMQLELQRRGLNPEFSADVVVGGVIGGILGARLWYMALHGGPLLSRGGLVWYGGFLGGVIAVVAMGWWKRVPLRFTFELAAPALALGHGLGRVGCFLVQDDYGMPTTMPWGLKFPQGQPPTTAAALAQWGIEIPAGTPPSTVLAVHPTQLYEVAALLFIFWLLWRLRRHEHAVGWLFGAYLVAIGVERFLVEFVRAKDDRFLGVFTLAQATSIVLLIVGLALMRWLRTPDGFTPRPVDGLAPRTTD